MKRAIIIGLNYTGEEYALPDCEIDAEIMAGMLDKAGVETTIITGECRPEWLVSHLINVEGTRMRKIDTLYLYFSGHGTQVQDKTESGNIGEAICLYDKRRGIVALRDDDLKAAIDRIPGTKIIILDSCFSGGMDRGAVEPGLLRKYIAYPHMEIYRSYITRDVYRLTPQYFLFACGEGQVSYSTGNGGTFTLALKKCDMFNYRSLSKILNLTKIIVFAYGQTPTAHIVGGSYSKKIL